MNFKFFKRELDDDEKSYYSSRVVLGGLIIYGLSDLSTKTVFINLVNCGTEEKIKETMTHEMLHIVIGKEAFPSNVNYLECVINSLSKEV